jgi:hypothetical protein
MIAEKCVYCSDGQGITKDHVPPRSFFPEPRPANLITVPSYKICNSGAAIDGSYLLTILMFSDAGNTVARKGLSSDSEEAGTKSFAANCPWIDTTLTVVGDVPKKHSRYLYPMPTMVFR